MMHVCTTDSQEHGIRHLKGLVPRRHVSTLTCGYISLITYKRGGRVLSHQNGAPGSTYSICMSMELHLPINVNWKAAVAGRLMVLWGPIHAGSFHGR